MARQQDRRRGLGVAALVALGLGCGGASADRMNSTSGDPVEVPPWACVPGETQPCDCGAELPGLQTCLADGSALGECDCSPAAMSQGPPPTSTDSGSGSGTTDGTGSSTTQGSGPGDSTTEVGSSSSGPDSTTAGGSSSGSTT